MEKPDIRYCPSSDYRFWLYDPEGDGMVYFRSQEARDLAGQQAIEKYLGDGWDSEVERVAAGVLTHFAQVLDKTMRPASEDIGEDGCDANGVSWPDEMDWRGNYTLASLDAPGKGAT